MLETFAWRPNFNHQAEIHDRKLKNGEHNWEAGIRIASFLAALEDKVDLKTRCDLIRYIVKPTPEGFENVAAQTQKIADSGGRAFSWWWQGQKKDLKDYPMSLSNLEKVPSVQFLLHALLSNTSENHVLDELITDILGKDLDPHRQPDNRPYRLLKHYLNSIPEYERASMLAYFFANSGDGQEDQGAALRAIFELFTTVGVKTGQLAAIWELAGDPSHTSALEKLKDDTLPMEHSQIVEILQKTYGGRVKPIQILGSASIKTVVEVELPGGEHAVAMIRRPYALDQTRDNLKRAQKLLAQIETDPDPVMKKMSRSLKSMLNVVESQLNEELDFQNEIFKTQLAGKTHGSSTVPQVVRKTKGNGNQPWTLRVPQPIGGDLAGVKEAKNEDGSPAQVLLMEFGRGKKWNQLGHEVQGQVGYIIFNELVQKLFQQGFMNADA